MTGRPYDGGPILPLPDILDTAMTRTGSYGLTVRDYFAATALQGILTNQSADATCAFGHADVADVYAEASYKIADAMLKQRTV